MPSECGRERPTANEVIIPRRWPSCPLLDLPLCALRLGDGRVVLPDAVSDLCGRGLLAFPPCFEQPRPASSPPLDRQPDPLPSARQRGCHSPVVIIIHIPWAVPRYSDAIRRLCVSVSSYSGALNRNMHRFAVRFRPSSKQIRLNEVRHAATDAQGDNQATNSNLYP